MTAHPFLTPKTFIVLSVFCGLVVTSCLSDQSVSRQEVRSYLDEDDGVHYMYGRKDNDLVATYGTCYIDDFRYFTMLHQEAWNILKWETCGNAVQEHRTWRNWPYEQRLSVRIDGQDVGPEDVSVKEVEQQFDFRQTSFSAASVQFERLDMMMSGRSWMTALKMKNSGSGPAKVRLSFI